DYYCQSYDVSLTTVSF
nr:immunoglobulin light chain junction region [Macaca mulatta]